VLNLFLKVITEIIVYYDGVYSIIYSKDITLPHLFNSLIIFNNNIYGCAPYVFTDNVHIQMLDHYGKLLKSFDHHGEINSVIDGQINIPTDICEYNNKIYITDPQSEKIHMFNEDGKFIKRFQNISHAFNIKIYDNIISRLVQIIL
jgi:hypothetical protein